jgi:type IV secretion system protein VirB1
MARIAAASGAADRDRLLRPNTVDASVFLSLAPACAPQVHADTAQALVSVESAFNPWAIGVVGGALVRQPQNRTEAIATAKALRAAGWNFSVGLSQINVGNFERLGLTVESAFEPCTNLAAMQTVLAECFDRASGTESKAADQVALRKALSCYYSGNFATGFRHGYVRKVVVAARAVPTAQPKEKV